MGSATKWIKRNMIENTYGFRTSIRKLRKMKKASEIRAKEEAERRLLNGE